MRSVKYFFFALFKTGGFLDRDIFEILGSRDLEGVIGFLESRVEKFNLRSKSDFYWTMMPWDRFLLGFRNCAGFPPMMWGLLDPMRLSNL